MHFIEGDYVTVIMARNDIFDWQTGPRFGAEIIHAPCDTGDMWHFKVLLVQSYVHLAINPCSSEFVGLEVHEPH